MRDLWCGSGGGCDDSGGADGNGGGGDCMT